MLDATEIFTAVGYVGAALGAAMVIPQIVRAYRHRSLPGVSVAAWSLTALGCFAWMLYGVRAGELPQIPSNAITVAGAIAIVVAVPASLRIPARVLALSGGMAVLVGAATILPTTVFGFVAFGIGLVSTLPQIVRSVRGTSGGGSAVSVPTWALYGLSQACWLTYGIAIHDIVVTISSTVVLLSAAVICTSEFIHARAAVDGRVSTPAFPAAAAAPRELVPVRGV